MRKKIWTILLTACVFLSGTVLGFSTVYRVEDVTVQVAYVTEEAKLQGDGLQIRLEEAYEGVCTFFAKKSVAEEVIKEYPYFRISGFKKSYPKRLVFEVTENAEVYAIEKTVGAEYYVLSYDGVVLDIRDSHINPLSNEENVVLKGLTVSVTRGEKPLGDPYFMPMLSVCQHLSEGLNGIRANIQSIELIRRMPETIFAISTREGVKIYLNNPNVLTAEKVTAALNKYLSLSDEQKLTGRILLFENSGEIFSNYSAVDEFAG